MRKKVPVQPLLEYLSRRIVTSRSYPHLSNRSLSITRTILIKRPFLHFSPELSPIPVRHHLGKMSQACRPQLARYIQRFGGLQSLPCELRPTDRETSPLSKRFGSDPTLGPSRLVLHASMKPWAPGSPSHLPPFLERAPFFQRETFTHLHLLSPCTPLSGRTLRH